MGKVTVYLSLLVWRDFRLACLQHNISASQQIQALMEAQLAVWAEHERNHADVTPT